MEVILYKKRLPEGMDRSPEICLNKITDVVPRGDKLSLRFKDKNMFLALLKFLGEQKSWHDPSYEGDEITVLSSDYEFIINH